MPITPLMRVSNLYDSPQGEAVERAITAMMRHTQGLLRVAT